MAERFQAVVIGGGPGGYVCAIRLAQLGNFVVLHSVYRNMQLASQDCRLGYVLQARQTFYLAPPNLHDCQVRNYDAGRLLRGGFEVL